MVNLYKYSLAIESVVFEDKPSKVIITIIPLKTKHVPKFFPTHLQTMVMQKQNKFQ